MRELTSFERALVSGWKSATLKNHFFEPSREVPLGGLFVLFSLIFFVFFCFLFFLFFYMFILANLAGGTCFRQPLVAFWQRQTMFLPESDEVRRLLSVKAWILLSKWPPQVFYKSSAAAGHTTPPLGEPFDPASQNRTNRTLHNPTLPNLVTARDGSGAGIPAQYIDAMQKTEQEKPRVARLVRTPAQRQGNGKGIEATVVLLTTLRNRVQILHGGRQN